MSGGNVSGCNALEKSGSTHEASVTSVNYAAIKEFGGFSNASL